MVNKVIGSLSAAPDPAAVHEEETPTAVVIFGELPSWFNTYGPGCGYGYGFGSGDGFGFGYGDGYGSGYGLGYGYGYGSGDGPGDGFGSAKDA